MLRVVTSNNSEIFRHFGSQAFQGMRLDHSVATTYDAVLELVRTKRPQVAILDTELTGGDGYSLCRAIKDDPAISRTRVMLVVSSVVSRELLGRIESCGADDVLAPPLRADELHCHLATVADLPYRRHRRIDAPVEILVEGRELTAQALDLSIGGLGVALDGPVECGEALRLRLRHGGRELPTVVTEVAWVSLIDGAYRVGLQFVELPIQTRLAIEALCLFDVRSGDDALIVSLHGDLTETTDFAGLAARLHDAPAIEFHLREVRYISSVGVRAWCRLLEQLAGKRYSFRQASVAFASQVAMMPGAVGSGRILSFEAPYRCETCDRDDVRLLETASIAHHDGEPVPPTLHCGTCGEELVFDDIPFRYLAFCG